MYLFSLCINATINLPVRQLMILKEGIGMKKNLGVVQAVYPMPVLIVAAYDENGKVVGYYSVRRRPSKEGVETIQSIYAKLLEIEKSQGVDKGVQFVQNFLKENNTTWDEFIINLQNKGKTGGYR